MKTIKIYTDGACKANGKKDAVGGWGYVIFHDSEEAPAKEGSGGEKNTTNNRMEMLAVINSLAECPENERIIVYTDSAYIHNCMKQKWYKAWLSNNWVNASRQPVKNRDLWEKLIPYFENPLVDFEKVKGHSKNENEHEKWNNYVDKLAVAAAVKVMKGE